MVLKTFVQTRNMLLIGSHFIDQIKCHSLPFHGAKKETPSMGRQHRYIRFVEMDKLFTEKRRENN